MFRDIFVAKPHAYSRLVTGIVGEGSIKEFEELL